MKLTERTLITTTDPNGKSSYFFTRRIFIFFLALIYGVAFLSLWPQAAGLWGERGILPAASDASLLSACAAGIFFSILILLDVAPAIFLALNWFLYLYFVSIGGDFMRFQWDSLLLEAGFLAIFFAPFRLKPRPAVEEKPSVAMLWLLRLLLL